MPVLFENNEYFQNGAVCQEPLKTDVEVCCEVENEEGRTDIRLLHPLTHAGDFLYSDKGFCFYLMWVLA